MCNATWIGQTVPGTNGKLVEVQTWGYPAEFLYVSWLFLFPVTLSRTTPKTRHLITGRKKTDFSRITKTLLFSGYVSFWEILDFPGHGPKIGTLKKCTGTPITNCGCAF